MITTIYQVQRVDFVKYSWVGLQSSLSLGAGVVEVGEGCDPSRTARNEHPNMHSDPTRTSPESVSPSIVFLSSSSLRFAEFEEREVPRICSHFFETKTLDMYIGDSGRRIQGGRQS